MAERESNAPLRRAIRYLFILQGQCFQGARLKQIADAMDIHPSMALRDLETLAEEGVVERITGREEYWRLTPRTVQLSRALQDELDTLRRKTDEFDHRYTRLPN